MGVNKQGLKQIIIMSHLASTNKAAMGAPAFICSFAISFSE